ncbi:MAG: ATP-dependent helicase, partial [Burkholderiales bacterium]|nr:ATP-dependent helicase [Burkholderiales bacterium]
PADAPRRAPAPSRDPFFDQPYEQSADAAPVWEAAPKAAAATAVGARGLSPNIRPKKKVASLLGG